MTSSNQIPEDRDLALLRYRALRQLRIKPVSKRVLSKIANSYGFPAKFMDIVLDSLVADGDVSTYVPDNRKKPGPNPTMYKLTDLGLDTLKELAKDA